MPNKLRNKNFHNVDHYYLKCDKNFNVPYLIPSLTNNKNFAKRIRKASTASNSASAAQSGMTLNSDESVQNLAVDTLSELDWCLNQLENIQTHRSVSEMASTKFKKMMNDELSHLSLNDKEGNEVTKYLTTNFLDKDREDPEVPGDEVTTPMSPTRPSPFYPASRSINNKPTAAPSSQLSHPYDEDTCNVSALPNHFPPMSKVLQRGQTVPNCFCTCSKQLTPPGPFLSSHTLSQSSPPYPVTDATIMPSRFPTFVHHSVDEEDDTETRSHSSDHPASTAARYSTATSRYLHRHSAHHATVHGTGPQGSKTFNVMSSIMGFNPICIHIHSFRAGIPRYGVKVVDEHALGEQISQVDKWGMDIFKLHEVSHHRPLTSLTYTILKKRGLISTFDIPVPNLLNFLMCVEDHYLDIPYHNRIHATDVTQSSHILLSSAAFKNCFNELEQLAIIIASAIHDVDHPGYTNQFLINSCSDLALIYNDSSVLENHHLAIAFKILQEPKCDIFANVSSKKKGIIRRLIIDLVLATDMSKHMKLLADLKTMVETRKISGTGESQYDFAEKNRVLQAMIHCGDLSNPTKPLDIYLKWTSLIMEEYFLQGEKEKQCGLQVSPMCDRETASIDKTQIGFMDYIVQPLWETWADLVHPDCQPMLNNLEKNREYFEGILHERECEKQKSSLPTTASPKPPN